MSMMKGHDGACPSDIMERLDREIYGFMVDMRVADQSTDEFLDQEPMVKRFVKSWGTVVDKVRARVIKQIESGETEVNIE